MERDPNTHPSQTPSEKELDEEEVVRLLSVSVEEVHLQQKEFFVT